RGTVLTEEGLRIAGAIVERHQTLTRVLRLFGLDEDTIYRDVEGMEHHVSKPTLEVIRAVADALEGNDKLLSEVKRRIRKELGR
ncbi:MAG: iron dependent repressor, metal binding and dimerization domain protein, partial [Akkermansiaceae bacterium]